jgi:hypothetical protein
MCRLIASTTLYNTTQHTTHVVHTYIVLCCRLDVPSWSYEGHCGWFGSKKSDLPDDIKDHLGRPRKVAPVTTTRHSRFDHLCKGTWLAECSIVHPEGGFILAVST